MEDKMIELNAQPGLDQSLGVFLRKLQQHIMDHFPDEPLVGVEMGIAYGGGVEALSKLWGKRGTIYGYDTFEGHPKQIATSDTAPEATCMDDHYNKYGRDGLDIDYQKKHLAMQGIDNVILVKGLVNSDSCWRLPKIHYCLLDMDILVSMKEGYEAVRHRIVNEGVLCLHDVCWPNQLPELRAWYEEIKKEPQWEVVIEVEKLGVAVLMRIR
jgi:hypothetical protein